LDVAVQEKEKAQESIVTEGEEGCSGRATRQGK